METASQEQRAADSLRSIGATEAARAAQNRADKSNEASKCKEAVECSLDIIGQLLLGMFGGNSNSKR
jgi:F0F1-type ATP synthase assembly protein I